VANAPIPGKRGRPSKVDTHPDRAAIQIALANGVSQQVLARRYGIDRSSLSRYRASMPEELVQRLRVRPQRSDEELAHLRRLEADALLDQLAVVRARQWHNADRAMAIGDEPGERAALAEVRKTTEALARLLGEFGVTVNHNHKHLHITATPEWAVLRGELVRALRPYPEAFRATVAALERAEAAVAKAGTMIEGDVTGRINARLEALPAAEGTHV